MTSLTSLKIWHDDNPEVTALAVDKLAIFLLHHSKDFDYDGAVLADARVVAAAIIKEAESLCEDEGCPQHGTVHVCAPKTEQET